MVKIEGRFGVIPELNWYGLVEVTRIWTPEGELIEDPPRTFTHDPVCAWHRSESPAAQQAAKPKAQSRGVGDRDGAGIVVVHQ